MNGEELFLSNLHVIERASRFVAGRAGLSAEDAEDLLASLKLRLIENDYAVLRKFQGRCALATYIASIAHRLFADDWMHTHGRWRPSAEAKRLGETAILLEGLLFRDRLSLEEALPIVQRREPAITKEKVVAIAGRLPQRTTRPRLVPLSDEWNGPSVGADSVEDRARAQDLAALNDRVNHIVHDALEAMTQKDRVVIRLLFYSGMRVADIARSLGCDQKQLYRRIETMKRHLREALLRADIDAATIDELIGGAESHLDFGLRKAEK